MTTRLRLDTFSAAMAATQLEELGTNLTLLRARSYAIVTRVGQALPDAVRALSTVESDLAEIEAGLRRRIRLAEDWDGRLSAEEHWDGVWRLSGDLAHLGGDLDSLLRRLPEADRSDDPIDALIRQLRRREIDIHDVVRELARHFADRTSAPPAAIERVADLIRAVVGPDVPDPDIREAIVGVAGLLEHAVASGEISEQHAASAIAVLIGLAITQVSDPHEILDAIAEMDADILDDLPTDTLIALVETLIAHDTGMPLDSPQLTSVIRTVLARLADGEFVHPDTLELLFGMLLGATTVPLGIQDDLMALIIRFQSILGPGGSLHDQLGTARVQELLTLPGHWNPQALAMLLASSAAAIAAVGGDLPTDGVTDAIRDEIHDASRWIGMLLAATRDLILSDAVFAETVQDTLSLGVGAAAGLVPYIGPIVSAFLLFLDGRSGIDAADADLSQSREDLRHQLDLAGLPDVLLDSVIAGFTEGVSPPPIRRMPPAAPQPITSQ